MSPVTARWIAGLRRLPVLIASLPIWLYRYGVSPVIGPRCRFEPSCSAYGLLALRRFGVVRGGWLTTRRLLRCHPWHPGGVDPVPAAEEEPPAGGRYLGRVLRSAGGPAAARRNP